MGEGEVSKVQLKVEFVIPGYNHESYVAGHEIIYLVESAVANVLRETLPEDWDLELGVRQSHARNF